MEKIAGPVDATSGSDQEIEIEIETGGIGLDQGTATIDAAREAAQGREIIEEIAAARIEIRIAIETTRS